MTEVFGRVRDALLFVAQNDGPAIGGEQSFNSSELEGIAQGVDNWLRLTDGGIPASDHNLAVAMSATLRGVADPRHVLSAPAGYTTSFVAGLADTAASLHKQYGPKHRPSLWPVDFDDLAYTRPPHGVHNIAVDLDRIEELAVALTTLQGTPRVSTNATFQALGKAATKLLLEAHNGLSVLIGQPANLDIDRLDNPELLVVASMFTRKETLAQKFTFVRGALADPFLTSEDDMFRKGAILNLIKARILIGRLIVGLTAHEFIKG